LRVVLEQIGRKPLYGIRRALLDQGGHAVEQQWHNGLVQVGADRQSLQAELVLRRLECSLRLGNFPDVLCGGLFDLGLLRFRGRCEVKQEVKITVQLTRRLQGRR
jgi:hypothetical protein